MDPATLLALFQMGLKGKGAWDEYVAKLAMVQKARDELGQVLTWDDVLDTIERVGTQVDLNALKIAAKQAKFEAKTVSHG